MNKISPLSSSYPGDYGTGGILEEYIGNMQQRYQNYIDFLLPLPNVRLIKYEQMVANYDLWLSEFIEPFPFTKGKKQRIIDIVISNKNDTTKICINSSYSLFPIPYSPEQAYVSVSELIKTTIN